MAHTIADMEVFKKVLNEDFLHMQISLLKPIVEGNVEKDMVKEFVNSDEFSLFIGNMKKICLYSVLISPLIESGNVSTADIFKMVVQNVAQVYASLKELRKSFLTHKVDIDYEKASTLLTNLKSLKKDDEEVNKLKMDFEKTLNTYYETNVELDRMVEIENHLFDVQSCLYELYGLVKTKKEDIKNVLDTDLVKFKVKRSGLHG